MSGGQRFGEIRLLHQPFVSISPPPRRIDSPLTRPPVIPHLVLGDPSQPPPKRIARFLAPEIIQLPSYGAQDFLNDIAGISRLQSGLTAPAVDVSAVRLHQPIPGPGIVQARLTQQRRRCLLMHVNVAAFHRGNPARSSPYRWGKQ